MNQDNRKNAHQEIDHIFKELLPAHGMAERPAQVALSHKMLDAILDGSIALCDAGTGIGKTYAYLVAGTVFLRCRAAVGLPFQPLLISTSSIALQNAVLNEYLPFLSAVLMAGQLIDHPLRAVVRKGKSHYVCDERLRRCWFTDCMPTSHFAGPPTTSITAAPSRLPIFICVTATGVPARSDTGQHRFIKNTSPAGEEA